MPKRHAYSVIDFPFWRFAVAIEERPDLPAIAFYKSASALLWLDEVKALFPDRTVVLLKRRFGGKVEVCSYV